MRYLLATLAVVCLALAGCGGDGAAKETGAKAATDKPATTRVPRPGGTPTAQLVRVLEEDQIKCIVTTHFQSISIELTDGRRFNGTYVPDEAGKYSDIRDALNLVWHIRDNRPPEETKNWGIWCE